MRFSLTVPTGAPTSIILTAEDSSTIKVRWTPPATYTIRGNLLGYKVMCSAKTEGCFHVAERGGTVAVGCLE